MIPACPSLMCSFNMGNTEETTSLTLLGNELRSLQ